MSVNSSAGSCLNEYTEPETHEKSLSREDRENLMKNTKCCGIRKMWLAAFIALVQCFAFGLGKGYSSPALYDMQHRDNSAIKPTENEVMWIGSMLALGGVFGSLIAGNESHLLTLFFKMHIIECNILLVTL